MLIHERYIRREVALATLLVLAAFLGLFGFFDLINELDNLGRGNYGLQHAVMYTVLTMPGRVYETLPIAVLIGALYSLTTLSRHSEITVLRASGMSTGRILRLLARIGLPFVLLTFVTGEFIAPPAERAAQELKLSARSQLLTGEFRSFPADHYVFMATAQGTVKKTALDEFSNPRKAGIIAVDLDEGDYLIGAALTDGKHDVMLFSDGGKAVRFDENDVRPMGRQARGVRGMSLEAGQSVIAMLVADQDDTHAMEDPATRVSVLTATENGYGKRTPIVEYTRHGRGTKGMIAIQQSERNGKVVAATLVRPSDEIMLITDRGVVVRTRVSEIRELGRATQGVTLIALDDGAKLSGLQRIVENDAADKAADPEGPEEDPNGQESR